MRNCSVRRDAFLAAPCIAYTDPQNSKPTFDNKSDQYEQKLHRFN